MRGNVITVATLFTSSLWGVQQHTPSALIKKLSEAYVETSYSQQITESDAMKLLFCNYNYTSVSGSSKDPSMVRDWAIPRYFHSNTSSNWADPYSKSASPNTEDLKMNLVSRLHDIKIGLDYKLNAEGLSPAEWVEYYSIKKIVDSGVFENIQQQNNTQSDGQLAAGLLKDNIISFPNASVYPRVRMSTFNKQMRGTDGVLRDIPQTIVAIEENGRFKKVCPTGSDYWVRNDEDRIQYDTYAGKVGILKPVHALNESPLMDGGEKKALAVNKKELKGIQLKNPKKINNSTLKRELLSAISDLQIDAALSNPNATPPPVKMMSEAEVQEVIRKLKADGYKGNPVIIDVPDAQGNIIGRYLQMEGEAVIVGHDKNNGLSFYTYEVGQWSGSLHPSIKEVGESQYKESKTMSLPEWGQ